MLVLLCQECRAVRPYHERYCSDATSSNELPITRLERVPIDPFMTRWTALYEKMLEIRKRKRNDYTGDNPDNLANYRLAAQTAGTSVPLLMLGRVQEKVTRASVLLQGQEQQVLDENIEDTMLDIANIALLIGAELGATE